MQVQCLFCGHSQHYIGIAPRFCSNCGKPLNANEPTTTEALTPESTQYHPPPQTISPFLPETIGEYRLLHTLGAGGMGSVYEAEEIGTGRRVALKLIRPEFADSPDALERFRREGRIASTIVHPRCVFVYTADEDEGRPYIVMELMPGKNLNDVVAEDGPMSMGEAVRCTLDIIEGLQEAHRCGVVHRDVKPSNCFLDDNNRVKVGDFGLAKSLLNQGNLTQSGAFLGTLLFAAPEQIRNESIDQQADIYAVAATLYFLLTGRAPFQVDNDPAATLARTMTDPVPPMRHTCSDVPGTLDAVVAKGLARSKADRWQSLEAFRLALLPFVPGRHSLADLGLRIGAYAADLLLLVPLEMLVLFALRRLFSIPQGDILTTAILTTTTGILYFTFLEGFFGCSLGKLLLRLRVRTTSREDKPSLLRTLLRSVVFFCFKDSISLLFAILVAPSLRSTISEQTAGQSGLFWIVLVYWVLSPVIGSLLGLLLLALTMNRRNGYRGAHELLSGTKTIRLPAGHKRPPLFPGLGRGRTVPDQGSSCIDSNFPVPERLGAFTVRGTLRADGEETILLGEDSGLGRRVWIWLRNTSTAVSIPDEQEASTEEVSQVTNQRRSVGRATRPRWLHAGEHENQRWDAFVGCEGCSLPELIRQGRRFFWPETLTLLEQLADELESANNDQTLPAVLSVANVWIQPSGRVQLLDTPMEPPSSAAVPEARADDPQDRCLLLLGQTARLALEGRLGSPSRKPRPIAAPLPGHAAALLHRLVGFGERFSSIRELQRAFEKSHDLPMEVSRPRRNFHLFLTALLVGPGLLMMLVALPLMVYGRFADRFFATIMGEAALRAVQASQPTEVAMLAGNPAPWSRLGYLGFVAGRSHATERLRTRLEQIRREEELVTASSSWLMNRVRKRLHEGAESIASQADALSQSPHNPGEAWAFVDEVHRDLDRTETTRLPSMAEYFFDVGILAVWPILWMIWAVLTRGGVGSWIAGIRLVHGDGRPASWYRCALRCFLVWAPLVLCLSLSLGCDFLRIHALLQGQDGIGWEILSWLAWLLAWVAVLLLPIYVWLAQRSPARGLHDRLCGLYAVPK